MMLRAILIDDEQISLNALADKIRQYCPDLDIVGVFIRPELALPEISLLKPDVLFLDIEMPRLNGFHFLEALQPISFEVIFTTAYSGYAIEAVRLPALDFLVKPIDEKELIASVQRLKSRKNGSQITGLQESQLRLLIQKAASQGSGKVVFPVLNGLELIAVNDIIKIRADNVYSVLYFNNGKTFTVTQTLKEVEILLSAYDFFRVHKSYIVHLKYVVRYIKGEGGYVLLTDGSEVEVSRRNKAEFLKKLQQG